MLVPLVNRTAMDLDHPVREFVVVKRHILTTVDLNPSIKRAVLDQIIITQRCIRTIIPIECVERAVIEDIVIGST